MRKRGSAGENIWVAPASELTLSASWGVNLRIYTSLIFYRRQTPNETNRSAYHRTPSGGFCPLAGAKVRFVRSAQFFLRPTLIPFYISAFLDKIVQTVCRRGKLIFEFSYSNSLHSFYCAKRCNEQTSVGAETLFLHNRYNKKRADNIRPYGFMCLYLRIII